jgi:transposase
MAGYQRGRKPVLDETKKRQVVSMLLDGCTRRAIARFFQCSLSTISRTAQRDPEFGEKVARAERGQEIWSARTVTRTCQQDKYWRAAAWVLERRAPEVYGKPQPGKYTGREVLRIVGEILETIEEDLSPEMRERVRAKIRRTFEERQAEEMPFLFNDMEATLDELAPDEPEPPELSDQRPDDARDEPESAQDETRPQEGEGHES